MVNLVNKKKILLCTEGEKTEKRILEHLFQIYGLDTTFALIPYKANVYQLYRQMFEGNQSDSLDLIQVLKERETDEDNIALLNDKYTDIFLVFDFDPQDHSYCSEHLSQMMQYFNESTDNGKLYLNYPMSESYYHMPTIPDPTYLNKTVSLQVLREHGYKGLVHAETVKHSYDCFAINKEQCNIVIKDNQTKAWEIVLQEMAEMPFPKQEDILNVQVRSLSDEEKVHVLSTMVSFILEYDSRLIENK